MSIVVSHLVWSGKWEVGSGKWEVGSGKWGVEEWMSGRKGRKWEAENKRLVKKGHIYM